MLFDPSPHLRFRDRGILHLLREQRAGRVFSRLVWRRALALRPSQP